MKGVEGIAVKVMLVAGAVILAASLFSAAMKAAPLALLVFGLTAAGFFAGGKSGRPGLALLVPLAAAGLGWAFAYAARGWEELWGREAQMVWRSWLTLGPLSSPANQAGRAGVVLGSLLGLAAPWFYGHISFFAGGKHSASRVHGLPVAGDPAKGTGRWAAPRDVADVCAFGPPRRGPWGGGIVLGLLGGRLVRVIPGKAPKGRPALAGHACVVGVTGSGKSYSFVRPNIVAAAEEGASVVVTDPKGELLETTGNWLRQRGYKVYVFNLNDPAHSMRWNPVQEARDDEEVTAFASAIIRNAAVEKSGYFLMKEVSLLKALIYLLKASFPEEQQHLRAALTLATWPPEALDTAFEEAYRAGRLPQPGYEEWRSAMSSNLDNAVSGVTAKLGVVRAPTIAALLSQHEIDLSAMGREKAALFCVLPINSEHLRPVLSVFYYFFFRRLYGLAAECGGRLPVPVRFILDEFANIGEVPGFVGVLSTARSLGISVQFILQGLSQLASVYDRSEMKTILGNCGTQLLLGTTDMDTASYFSRALGTASVVTVTESHDLTPRPPARNLHEWEERMFGYGRVRRTQQVVRRDLMTPEEILRLDPSAALALLQWHLPLYLEKLDWTRLPQAREIQAAGQSPVSVFVPARSLEVQLPLIPAPEEEEPPRRERRAERPGAGGRPKPAAESDGGGDFGGLADLFRPPSDGEALMSFEEEE